MSPIEFGTMRKLFRPVGTTAGQMFRKRLWFTNQLEGTKRFHGEGLIPRMTCMGKLIQNDPPKIQRFKKGKTLQSSTNEPAENMVRVWTPKDLPHCRWLYERVLTLSLSNGGTSAIWRKKQRGNWQETCWIHEGFLVWDRAFFSFQNDTSSEEMMF